MSILLTLIIYFVVFGLIWYLLTLLPLPAPFGMIVQILFIIVAIILLLSLTGLLPFGSLHVLR